MITFLIVLAWILAVLALLGLFGWSVWEFDSSRRRGDRAWKRGIVAAVLCVLYCATLVTIVVSVAGDDSGQCGAGTTRVVYRHGKHSTVVCEVTPR